MINEALDRTQIYHAMTTYGFGVDTADIDTILTAFTPDAVLEVRDTEHRGHDRIRAFYEAALSEGLEAKRTGDTRLLRHNLTTSYVTFDSADRATGRTYFFVITAHGPDHSGVYSDRFVRTGESWLMGERRVVVDWYSAGSWYESRRIKPAG
jgi:hypothetical protein